MNTILSDDSKFKCLGNTTKNKNTARIDTKLQRVLLELTKKDECHDFTWKSKKTS